MPEVCKIFAYFSKEIFENRNTFWKRFSVLITFLGASDRQVLCKLQTSVFIQFRIDHISWDYLLRAPDEWKFEVKVYWPNLLHKHTRGTRHTHNIIRAHITHMHIHIHPNLVHSSLSSRNGPLWCN